MRAACVLVCCLFACGPSGGDDVMGDDGGPGSDGSGNGKLIATGGVSNAPLGGTLHVFAVETNSSTPIANAAVQVGSLTGTTDASGLASFNDASLTGKVNITVSATGHAAATWVGVTGANVTVPLAYWSCTDLRCGSAVQNGRSCATLVTGYQRPSAPST